MGNRAVVNFRETPEIGVYLHWNGGRDSVEAFLKYCEERRFRTDDYGTARFVQIVSNFFKGNCSIGVNLLERLDCDNWDNGLYVVEDWEIVERKFFDGRVEQRNYNLKEMLLAIDDCQPEEDRIREWLTAMPVDKAMVGDTIVFLDYDGRQVIKKVLGHGKGMVSGMKVEGRPYVNRHDTENPEENPNNYPREFRLVAGG